MTNPRFQKTTKGIEVRPSWPGGPLREFAKARPHSSWGLHFDDAAYPWAGSYICADCKQVVDGIYFVPNAQKSPSRTRGNGWLCAACKEKLSRAARRRTTPRAGSGLRARVG